MQNSYDIDQIISQMTLEEKASIVAGVDNMYTNCVPRLDIPTMTVADGPHGLRKQIGATADNVACSEPATAFPTAVTLASSWNPNNAYDMGRAIGEECRHYGVGVLLGPGINIKRNPLCGRNFEYFSEDPLLTSHMAIGAVDGVQSNGVGVALKHYALNQSENYRLVSDSVCDMRAMREIYLKAFERVVKESNPASLMCSYNKINGEHASENEWLLTSLLRDEWGYDGLVMSDWGAVKDRIKSIKAGLDLEMPGDTKYCRRKIIDSVKDGTLDIVDLDKCVKRVLKFVFNHHHEDSIPVDFDAHHKIAGRIACDSAVLMKNDGALPLKKREKVLITGELFKNMRYQGAGSSQINPIKLTGIEEAFNINNADYIYSKGYDLSGEIDKSLVDECIKASEKVDTILVFLGLTDREESEGGDRTNISLAQNQLMLIDAIVKTGKKIVVVLFGGSVTSLPFATSVNAILNMFLPGQNGGEAVYKLVYGEVSPSGRLAESWVESIDQVPFASQYSNTPIEIYRESVLVGYRYHVTNNTKVAYPFGYGLSYTKFDYSNFSILKGDTGIKISLNLTNVGECFGGEVVQIYTAIKDSKVVRPSRELKAFTKVYLEPNNTKEVELDIPFSDLAYYDTRLNKWIIEDGEYEFSVGRHCNDMISSVSVKVDGQKVDGDSEDILSAYSTFPLEITDEVYEKMSGLKIPTLPPVKPFTLETRVEDLQYGRIGKLIYKILMSVPNSKLKKAKKLPLGNERDNAIKSAEFLGRMISSNCLRAMSMCDKRLPYNRALGLVHLANGRIFKSIGAFVKPIKVPPLPRDDK